MKHKNQTLSYDYIRGLTDGEGCFTFSPTIPDNHGRKWKIPAFSIKMAIRDRELLEQVRDSLGLRNRIYTYNHQGNDGSVRQPQAMLIVREAGALRAVIVPLFYKKLRGYKRFQFEEWIEKIGSDPLVPERYKILYRLYKGGFWDKNDHFL